MKKQRKPDGWRRSLRRLLGAKSGIAAVELAMIAPVLGVVIIGVVDYGRVYSRTTTLANAARAGTQYAMIRRPVQGDLTDITTAATDALPPDYSLADPGSSLAVERLCECPPVGSGLVACATPADVPDCSPDDASIYVRITVTERFATLFDYKVIPPTVDLSEQSIMRLR